ncbi:MAG: class I SAM-dependent methyltransferase [Bacteroidota bacterium]|nr:class I SAM-dependent methyltransferase [Bacteroidota bacterium]
MSADPTKRFTERVDNYVKYRPGYPDEVITFLQKECGLTSKSVIADIGSGTGIFTRILLDKGFKVYAIEPNQAMQQAARQWLGSNKNYTPIDAAAEATTLTPKSIDLIVCAQSFHWFNDERTRAEFKRILKDGRFVALIWNNRLIDVDEFSKAYEDLLKKDSIDYNKVNHRNVNDIDFKAFFKDKEYKKVIYPNAQEFDWQGLIGRAFSSSYVPPQNTDAGKKFQQLLQDAFAKYNTKGKVNFHYQTEIYIGRV